MNGVTAQCLTVCVSQAWMSAWSHYCRYNVDVSIRSQTIFTSAGFLYLKFYHLSQQKKNGSQKYPKVYFTFSLLILFGHKHLYLVSLPTWVRWPLSLSSHDQNCLNSLNSKKGALRFIMSFSREDKVLIVIILIEVFLLFIYILFWRIWSCVQHFCQRLKSLINKVHDDWTTFPITFLLFVAVLQFLRWCHFIAVKSRPLL